MRLWARWERFHYTNIAVEMANLMSKCESLQSVEWNMGPEKETQACWLWRRVEVRDKERANGDDNKRRRSKPYVVGDLLISESVREPSLRTTRISVGREAEDIVHPHQL